jgi:lipoprotein signal peptidase
VEPDSRPGVRDFLDWYVPEGTALARWLRSHEVRTHWYTFNVADALIVSGVVLLAWKILREKPPEKAVDQPQDLQQVAPEEGSKLPRDGEARA